MTTLETALLAGLLVIAALLVGNKILDTSKDAVDKIDPTQADQSSP